ncbi:MAG: hypothetical protein KDD44_11315, partial [Bdellovibrionales bacterium]|nr:hypothetical protein [Bdellovibrionales bacterium]
QHQPDRAIAAVRHAIHQGPAQKQPRARLFLVHLLLQLEDIETAREELRQIDRHQITVSEDALLYALLEAKLAQRTGDLSAGYRSLMTAVEEGRLVPTFELPSTKRVNGYAQDQNKRLRGSAQTEPSPALSTP